MRIWGFRGPLGAFVCAWGGVAMITSAPFDNWWHDAYGLDVKVLSPPHVLLIFGILVIRVGTLLLILGQLSHAEGALRTRLNALMLYTYTFLLVTSFGIFQEFLLRNYMHSALFYMLMTLGACFFLAGLYRMSDYRWAATVVTGIYTVLNLAVPLDSAAVSGRAEAGSGLPACDAFRAARFSDPSDRAGVPAGPDPALLAALEATGRARRPSLPSSCWR